MPWVGKTSAKFRRLLREKGWRRVLFDILAKWSRHHVRRIISAILIVWLTGATALHFAECGGIPGFKTWGESLWSVWVTLFSGVTSPPNTLAGRVIAVLV